MLLPWLPSAGTNRIRFQGLPGSPGSQLLFGAPPSPLFNKCLVSTPLIWESLKSGVFTTYIYYNTGSGEKVTPNQKKFFGHFFVTNT
ncbi:hypothetical protein CWRG_02422 [Chthonomonas calidirosea]|nr:hypothetical protein CWRG_02422 [Chthonomonas calidirosea]